MEAGGFTFPVMLEGADEAAQAYRISAIPTVFLIDAEGRIVDSFVGGATAAELSRLVDDLSG